MAAALDVEVVPGKRVGDFEIGMLIHSAIRILLEQPLEFPQVEIKYHPMRPLLTDTCIDIPRCGLLLRFESREQRLRQIEVYNPSLVGTLQYRGHTFCQSGTPPTLHKVCIRFGPSMPGQYSREKKVYKLRYPGISFYFPIPDRYASQYATQSAAEGAFVPLEFPDGSSPATSRIIVDCGGPHDGKDSYPLPPLPADSLYLEEVWGIVGKGILLLKRNKQITFQSSVQEVISAIGPPENVFHKEEDAMHIHQLSPHAAPGASSMAGSSDYLFNYFSLGIDVLFDHHSHYVKKICLHSNFPGHFDFNQYRKCNFRIRLEPAELGTPPRLTDSDPLTRYPDDAIRQRSDQVARLKARNLGMITSDLTWTEAACFFPTLPGRPIVDNRGSDANPFGSTRYYGFKNIVFEVMRNDHIASVLLFE